MDGCCWTKAFDQREPHPLAVTFGVADFVHDFANDVNTKTAGTDVIEVSGTDAVRIDLLRVVLNDNLDTGRYSPGARSFRHRVFR